ASILLSTTAGANVTSSSSGTNYAHPGQFPFMVSIRLHNLHVCTGAIVTPRWILTVAHCFQNISSENLKRLRVVAGTTNGLGNDGLEHHIQYLAMANYNKDDLINDIALIQLKKTLIYNKMVQEIAVGEVGLNKNVVAVGWGFNLNLFGVKLDLSGRLRHLLMLTTDDDYFCHSNAHYLCATALESNTLCDGASGGALVEPVSGRLVGVLSVGAPRCEPGYATGFTRLSAYRQWIKQKTEL
ncbi:Trypsin domain containing protein, partial [Asbolus verrucosus]